MPKNQPHTARHSVIGEVFDGLRDFYSRKEGINSAPAFSAAALLSFMLSVNVASVATLIDVAVHGRASIAAWFVRNMGVAIGAGVAVGWAHVAIAKYTGLYFRSGPPLSASWRRPFVAYSLTTFLLLVGCLSAAYLTRPDRL